MKRIFLCIICVGSIVAMEERALEKPADWPALHWAVKVGTVEDVEKVLNAGANIEEIFGAHGTALQIAARLGKTDVVDLLLSKGIDRDIPGTRKRRALEGAAEHSDVTMVKHHATKRAKISMETFLTAARHGKSEVCDYFIQEKLQGIDHSFLMCSCQSGSLELVKKAAPYFRIIDEQSSVRFKTTICQAAVEGHVSVVVFLLEKTGVINWKFGSALKLAAEMGLEEAVCLLLKNQADPFVKTSEPLPPVYEHDGSIIYSTVLAPAAKRGNNTVSRLLLFCDLFHNARKEQSRVITAFWVLWLSEEGPRFPLEIVLRILTSTDDAVAAILAMEAGTCLSFRQLKERIIDKRSQLTFLRQVCSERIACVLGNYTAATAARLWSKTTNVGDRRFLNSDIPLLNRSIDLRENDDRLLPKEARELARQIRCMTAWKQFIVQEFSVKEDTDDSEKTDEQNQEE